MESERFGEYNRGPEEVKVSRGDAQGWGERVGAVFRGKHEREVASDEWKERSAKEVLRLTEVEGDPFKDAYGKERTVTTKFLKEAKLEPTCETRVEGVDMYFSDMFKIEGRDAVIGYIADENGRFHARSYYRSESQGAWRYMPDRTNDRAGHVSWYGKGVGEESVTLPSELQGFLNGVRESTKYEAKREDKELAEKRQVAFFGVAKEAGRSTQNYEYRMNGRINDAMAREVKTYPSYEMKGNGTPESLILPKDHYPNFDSRPIITYQFENKALGSCHAKVFESYDKKLKWTISEGSNRRVWVSQVEVANSPMTSTGARADWVRAKDYTVPPYEYLSQSGGYGDMEDVKRDARGGIVYVGMMRNYLCRVPLIRDYAWRRGWMK